MEQPEGQDVTGPAVPVMPPRAAYSDEVRASMEAVRAAREAAHLRARRQTLHARLWFAAWVAVAALAAIVAGPRVANWRHARAHAKIAPTPGSFRSSPAPTKPAIAAPVAAPAIAPPVAAPAVVEAPGAPAGKAEAPESPATAPATTALPEKACDTTLIRRAPWRLSPDACARAFDAEPRNATLALAVAHAAHVRGRSAEAAEWARRALSLDPNAAEAWVIIARAEAGSGRQEDARAAYQHYLELAPRGWHRAEARAAVQRAR